VALPLRAWTATGSSGLSPSSQVGFGDLLGSAKLVLPLPTPRLRLGMVAQGSFPTGSRSRGMSSEATDFELGGLATVDLDAVRERIERIEWVDRAIVARRWPDSIRVEVTEQVPAARWNDTGLLNGRGELFLGNARHVPVELPRLEGPEGSERLVAQLYLDAQGRFLEAGLRLTGVRLDERGAWELELANGVRVRLGRLAVTDRLDRFVRLAGPLVAQRPAEIRYVDMRYTNGFSVGWNARSALAVAPQEDATPDA